MRAAASPTAMFSAFLGFAQIRGQDIQDGVLPKRQVVGTGVTTSTSDDVTSTDAPTTTASTEAPTTEASSTEEPTTTSDTAATTDTPTTTTSDAPSSTTAAPETTPSSASAEPTSAADPTSTTSDASSSDEPTSTAAAESTSATSSPTDSSSADSSSDATTSSSSPPSSTRIATIIPITTTDSSGSTITTSLSTSTTIRATSTPTTGFVHTATNSAGHPAIIIGTSTLNPSTFSSKTTITSALLGEVTLNAVTTTYWTTDGTTGSSVYTTARVLPTTTGYATATVDPKLASGNSNSGSSSGLSTSTKAIIGGVVGGIGGAILLGGLAIVAWRLWGKKKREALAQEDDFMDSRDDSIRREKRSSAMLPPARSSEYTPSGPINTASNF